MISHVIGSMKSSGMGLLLQFVAMIDLQCLESGFIMCSSSVVAALLCMPA